MISQPEPLFNHSVETSGFGVITLSTFDEFTPLESAWRALEDGGICTTYQRYDWVKGWAENVAPPAKIRPRLVLAMRGDEPLFVLPMGLRHRGPFVVCGWLGDSHSNFHMGLYSKYFVQNALPGDIRSIIQQVTKYLGHADILELCCQPVVWQGQTNPLTFLRWQESHNHAFALDLSEGFDAAINRKNGSRKRKKYRWQTNKLKDVGGAELVVADNEETANEILDVSYAQLGRRFDKAGIWNTFRDDGVETFFRELAISSLNKPEPELLLYGLKIDGKFRATFAGGIRQGQFSGCFISLADDEYAKISPGELIIFLVIQDCVKRGIQNFDLGRGEERYKTSWCDTTIAMFETNIALTKRAAAFSAYERGKITAKRIVRNNRYLWDFAKRVRSRFYGRI